MGKRIDNVLNIGGGIYRDPDEKVYIRIVKSKDNLPTNVLINSNTVNCMRMRSIEFAVNSTTDLQREVPIFNGSMKFVYPVLDPDGVNEKVCDTPPITNGENKIKFNKKDLIDTLAEIIDILDNDGKLF